jgi:hypothetical protein
MIIDTGDILSFLQIASPTGAIINTVATLSIKADTIPAKRDIKMVTHIREGATLSIFSAIKTLNILF